LPASLYKARPGGAELPEREEQDSGASVAYCALLPPSYDAEKAPLSGAFIFLHGLGDNEQMFLHRALESR